MQADNEQISASQLTFLLVNAITGIGVLVIPARAAKAAGSAGWLAVLVTGLICTLLVWLIVRLCRKYPDQTIVEISIGLLGNRWGSSRFPFFSSCGLQQLVLSCGLSAR